MPPDFDAGLIAYKHRSVSSCHFSLHENRLLFLVEREKQQESFFRQEETTAGNMFVFAGYHHRR